MVLGIAVGPGTRKEMYLSSFLINAAISERSSVPESS